MPRPPSPLVLLPFALALAACQGGHEQASSLPKASLTVKTRAGAHAFIVEVAASDADQERGLTQRRAVGADAGMAFPFRAPRQASFWMKDMVVPLDLLFVRPNGTIAAVLHGKPGDLHPLFAGEPVSAVVEIAGGGAAAHGIVRGDRVHWGDCSGRADAPGTLPDPERFCPAS